MTQHTCEMCDGKGIICRKCGRNHGRVFANRCTSKMVKPCPGFDLFEHFDTWTECDVCRITKKGERFVRTLTHGFDSHGWGRSGHITDSTEPIDLCPECLARFEVLKAMALERLKEERGQLHAAAK